MPAVAARVFGWKYPLTAPFCVRDVLHDVAMGVGNCVCASAPEWAWVVAAALASARAPQ